MGYLWPLVMSLGHSCFMTPTPSLSGVRQTFGDAPAWGGDSWCRVSFWLVVLSIVAIVAGVVRLNVWAALTGTTALILSTGSWLRVRLAWAKPEGGRSTSRGSNRTRQVNVVIRCAAVLFLIYLSFIIVG
jgi:hypothetical protein